MARLVSCNIPGYLLRPYSRVLRDSRVSDRTSQNRALRYGCCMKARVVAQAQLAHLKALYEYVLLDARSHRNLTTSARGMSIHNLF